MRKDFERMEELEDVLGVEIISYGLAPRPWGYCFEIDCEEAWHEGSKADKEELALLCDVAPEGFFERDN